MYIYFADALVLAGFALHSAPALCSEQELLYALAKTPNI